MDADFSNDTQLELWDLDLNNTSPGIEIQPAANIATDSRYEEAWLRHRTPTNDGLQIP